MQTSSIGVFIGIDVGKSGHWTTALDRDDDRLFDRTLPDDETRLRDLYEQLARHGQVLVVVDQPATIGTLAVAVTQDMGIPVGYLPGLSMRHIAGLTPGNARTDARDAAIIVQASRTMPHTLWAISGSDQDAAALSMLTGFDLDLARQVNQTSNRIRGPYTRIHPALEKVLGPRLECDTALEVIALWPVPTVLRKAGRVRAAAELKAHSARRHEAWVGEIINALEAQNVVVIGTGAAGIALPHLTRQLTAPYAQRRDVVARVGALVEAHPLYQVLTSMPGIEVRTVVIFTTETLGRPFDTGAYLASYVGFTPVTQRSGSSIHGGYTSYAGSKRLRRAIFLSAFASLRSDPVSRAYYDRKIAQSRRYNQAVITLAHHRILTLHTMIRNTILYNPQPIHQLPTVA